MDFAKGLVKAYQTKWSYINSFNVQITFADQIKRFIDWDDAVEGRDINLNIVSLDTPQFTNQPIEVYVGDRWKIHNGRDEMYTFTMTFRDQDQMNFYKKFLAAYLFQKTNWFDDVKMQITVWKDADYEGETHKKLFDFNDVMIAGVSQLQFNNTTEAQIAEFNIDFKCAMPLIDTNYKNGNFNGT